MTNAFHFTAKGNAVVGIEDAGLVAQGYANEPLCLVCLCYGVPGLGQTGADVAQVIADFLNRLSAEAIRDIGFSLPEEKLPPCPSCGCTETKATMPTGLEGQEGWTRSCPKCGLLFPEEKGQDDDKHTKDLGIG